jgi:hypothetical protein
MRARRHASRSASRRLRSGSLAGANRSTSSRSTSASGSIGRPKSSSDRVFPRREEQTSAGAEDVRESLDDAARPLEELAPVSLRLLAHVGADHEPPNLGIAERKAARRAGQRVLVPEVDLPCRERRLPAEAARIACSSSPRGSSAPESASAQT